MLIHKDDCNNMSDQTFPFVSWLSNNETKHKGWSGRSSCFIHFCFLFTHPCAWFSHINCSIFNIRLLISPFAFYSYLDQWVNVWSVGQCFPNRLHLWIKRKERRNRCYFCFSLSLFSCTCLSFQNLMNIFVPILDAYEEEERCSEYWCCAGW